MGFTTLLKYTWSTWYFVEPQVSTKQGMLKKKLKKTVQYFFKGLAVDKGSLEIDSWVLGYLLGE